MSGKKIFVFMVTGDQGGSVAKYLVEDGWEVSGLTRNLESDKAKALAKTGVKLVKGDLADPKSYQDALKGQDVAFVNGDFWGPYYANGMNAEEAGETEKGQSKAAVDACVKAGVGHIIFSSLKTDSGDFTVPHFESKNEVAKYLKTLSVPHTELHTAFYWENFYKFGMLKPDPENKDGFLLEIPIMDYGKIPGYAVTQTGGWVRGIVKDLQKFNGKEVRALGEENSYEDMAKILSEVFNKKVRTSNLSKEAFEGIGNIPQAKELWLNLKAFQEGMVKRDEKESKEVYPGQSNFTEWVKNDEAVKKILGV